MWTNIKIGEKKYFFIKRKKQLNYGSKRSSIAHGSKLCPTKINKKFGDVILEIPIWKGCHSQGTWETNHRRQEWHRYHEKWQEKWERRERWDGVGSANNTTLVENLDLLIETLRLCSSWIESRSVDDIAKILEREREIIEQRLILLVIKHFSLLFSYMTQNKNLPFGRKIQWQVESGRDFI